MPSRDGTGPMGVGAMTGRGLGTCGAHAVKYGAGLGLALGLGYACRRGFGCGFRNVFFNQSSTKTPKAVLQEQKEALQRRLEVINQQLENS